jgi:hypothetical protein
MNSDYFLNMHWKMWIEDDVLRGKVFADTLTLNIVETGVRERVRLCSGTAFPVLSDIRRIKHVDKEARAYLAKSESTVFIRAGAFLVNNQLQKILGNFFILIDKPEIPTRLFTDEAEALAWLQQFKNIRSTA